MKKLVLILAALVAVVAFAMPLFADDQFEVSGEFSFGMLTAFDSEKDAGAFTNAYIDLFFYPDEYNEVFLELGWTKEWDYRKDPTGSDIAATYFALRTDVGAFLGLPIGVVNHAGVDSVYTNKYEVSGHAYERTLIRSAIDPVPWIVALDGGSWQAKFAIGWGQTDPSVGEPKGSNNDIGFYVFIPAVGPAEIEAWYLAQDNPDWKGRLGASAKADGLAGGLFGVAGGFVYDMNDGSSRSGGTDKLWAYGVGVGLDYMGGALGFSLNGDDTDTLYQMGIDLDYAFGDFGVIAAAGFNFGEGFESFQGLDVGVYAKVGGAKWQVGYLYRDMTDYSYTWAGTSPYAGAPAAAPDGGLYFFADIDF